MGVETPSSGRPRVAGSQTSRQCDQSHEPVAHDKGLAEYGARVLVPLYGEYPGWRGHRAPVEECTSDGGKRQYREHAGQRSGSGTEGGSEEAHAPLRVAQERRRRLPHPRQTPCPTAPRTAPRAESPSGPGEPMSPRRPQTHAGRRRPPVADEPQPAEATPSPPRARRRPVRDRATDSLRARGFPPTTLLFQAPDIVPLPPLPRDDDATTTASRRPARSAVASRRRAGEENRGAARTTPRTPSSRCARRASPS